MLILKSPLRLVHDVNLYLLFQMHDFTKNRSILPNCIKRIPILEEAHILLSSYLAPHLSQREKKD
jgi:hypothetical protein